MFFSAYFDADDDCNDLDFQFGNTAIDATIPSRSFTIRVTQYSCDFENLAPEGCDQYFYGTGGTNDVYTFNYGDGTNRHLANQKQTICVRY